MDIRAQLAKGLRAQGTELTTHDIGNLLSLGEGFGVVQHNDVGKRVWSKPWGFVMENNEQRNKRKGG